jgi:hypothetical protein
MGIDAIDIMEIGAIDMEIGVRNRSGFLCCIPYAGPQML